MTGLEALEKLDETLCDIEIKHKENLGYTKPLTRTIEKSLKALEIISKKNIDMLLIKKYDNASDYNSAVWLSGREKLTEEEFELLRSVLEC